MSDGPLFEGIRQYGDGPNPLNEEPEPSFDSPELGIKGMVLAMQPEAHRIEQRLTAIAGAMVARLIHCANKYCIATKPELSTTAMDIESTAMETSSTEMDRDSLLAEYALKHTETILAFKDEIRALRNNPPSTKLNETLSRIKALRGALSDAA